MKKLVVLFLILGLVVSNLNADVLCVKKKVTIVNGKVKTWGKSNSLGKSSQEGDAELISIMLGLSKES
jgi:uncharacterized membrane protein